MAANEHQERRRTSAAPELLHATEEDFLSLVKEGNVDNVKMFLDSLRDGNYHLNTDIVNFRNMSAMSLAVESGNWEMIQYLMTVMKITKRRVLMMAVHEGNMDLVVKLSEDDSHVDPEVDVGEDAYPTNLTPLMLAAVNGKYEIIEYLLSLGQTIPMPHFPACECNSVCLPSHEQKHDKLDQALFTFWHYSALCSPEYFVFITNDPLLYAFKMHNRITKLQDIEKPFKLRYARLARNLRKFTADLIGECVNTKEIETVLNKYKSDDIHSVWEKFNPQEMYPRLTLAMEYNQREFVTHPKVQLFLQNRFYGEFVDWRYYSNMSKMLFPFIRLCTFPSALFCIAMYPSSSEAKFYASPMNRLLHSLMFYLLFLVALFLESSREKPPELQRNMNSIWSLIIFVYFCTTVAALIHQILHLRPGRFFRNGWNLYDVFTMTMFGLYLSFNVASMLHYVQPHARHQQRKYWAAGEPQLIAEGFLVIASALAYLKLMFFLQAHAVMGPLQVALGQIIKACARYSFFGIIILLAYTTAFCNFYQYYEGMIYHNRETSEVYYQGQSFVNWMSSFKTFFWAMFTQLDPSVADVVMENPGGEIRYNEHIFTEFIGYFGLGTYCMLVVMVIVNMLIAAISETFSGFLNNVHESWLFVRTEMYIYFMNYPVLPPPFNFFPNWYRLRDLINKSDLEKARAAKGRSSGREKYMKIMRCLVQRYFATMGRQRVKEPGPSTEELQKMAGVLKCDP